MAATLELNYLAASWHTIHPRWQQILSQTCADQLVKIDQQLSKLIAEGAIIYPPQAQILRALSLAPEQAKVVILGQDPYHGEHQAMGLAFAVNQGVKSPPSLVNIFKELKQEYNPTLVNFGSHLLEDWFSQGVLLLNASLTVLKDQANSLAQLGWQLITDQIIYQVSQHTQHCVFLLWGNYARSKKALIDENKHAILQAVHPSPLSAARGFFGCNHFRLANQYLQEHQRTPIYWLGLDSQLI